MNLRSILYVLCALGVGLACSGTITSPGFDNNANASSGGGDNGSDSGAEGGPVTSGGSSGSSSGGSSGGAPTVCNTATPRASVVLARLLSPRQYDNTVQDLLGVGGTPAETNGVAGGESFVPDKNAVSNRAAAADAIATQAVASMAAWSPCMPPAVPVATCELQIINQIGQRAYRRPLSATDISEMQTLFDAGLAQDFATGVKWFLKGVLQTPDFQYQLVRPSASEQAGQMVPISGYEMASRLSYFVWDSMPDGALFAAAAAPGGLADAQSQQEQLNRLVQDPTRLVRGVGGFYSNWLEIDSFAEVSKDAAFNSAGVAQALAQSFLLTATQLYTMAAPNISSLYSGDTYPMNSTLQTYYGLPGAGTAAYTPTPMPNQHRSGILTHPGFLALLARPTITSPINRGVFILSKVMCENLMLPLGFTPPSLPNGATPGQTTRQQVEISHAVGSCKSCHDMIDPPGFALEGFDPVGNVRTIDNGLPVNTSGTIINSQGGTAVMSADLNGPFATGDEFLAKVATSATAKACFAQQYLEHAISGDTSTSPAPDDQCSVNSVSTAFAKTGDLKGLVGLVAASDSFRFRKSEGAPQ